MKNASIRLSQLLEDGKVYVKTAQAHLITNTLTEKEIPYFEFPLGSETLLELDIKEGI